MNISYFFIKRSTNYIMQNIKFVNKGMISLVKFHRIIRQDIINYEMIEFIVIL